VNQARPRCSVTPVATLGKASRSAGMKLETARALPPQDDQLMSQGDKLEFQRRSAAKTEREHGSESR
jgi:hypothetical protein